MSLFDIEIKSHWLKEQLGKPHSTRLRLLYLSNFLSELIKSEIPNKYISYYNEFESELVKLILKNEFQYFSPYEIENISFIVKYLEALSFSKESLEKCIGILQSARNEIFSILTGNDNKEVKSHRDSLNVVLIETNSDEKRNVGTIQTLTLRSSKRGKEFLEDKIEFENLCENDHEKLFSYIANIVSFSKEQAKKVIAKSNAYNLTFSFGNKDCSYTGSSFGPALLAIAYNSILVNELHRIYYRFYDDVVITGAIDEKGNLLKLDTPTLKVKIETVFFSRFTKFVIPEDNIVEAKETLSELQNKFPQRRLELIPCANFKSTFQNLAIVEVHQLRFKEKLKANYEQYHRTINWAFTFVASLTIVYLVLCYVIPYLDRNPVSVDLVNSRYVAFNKYGKIVWESELLSRNEIEYAKSIYGPQRILISDLDNDSQNEILLLRISDNDKTLKRRIFCYNSDGALKWETYIPPKDSIYGSDECYDNLWINGITVINNTTSKDKEIIAGYKICDLFPYYLSRINSSGKIISDFYHPGHLSISNSYDLDNDGVAEYLIGGENNDLEHCAVLLIFDPNNISGSGPGKRFPRNFGKGLVKYYILFPKSPFNKFTSSRNAFVQYIEIAQDKITVGIQEVLNAQNQTKNGNVFFTLYTFDKKLNVISFSTSTEFDVVYKILLEEKKIQTIKDWKAMEDSLKSKVRWWDGDKFVNYPTMNKYYLQARTKQDPKTALKSYFPQ